MLQVTNLKEDAMVTALISVAEGLEAVEPTTSAARNIAELGAVKTRQPAIGEIDRNTEVVTAPPPVVFSGAVGYGACCLWQWALVS